jgi:hypothetical protein
MKAASLVITAAALIGASLLAQAQNQTFPGPVQPRPGEGWTTEDARKIEPVPRYSKIAATIVKLSVVKRTGRFIVTLDNGTRWSQDEDRNEARVAIGDDIVLEKANIGSYTLITKDGVQTRVKRQR